MSVRIATIAFEVIAFIALLAGAASAFLLMARYHY